MGLPGRDTLTERLQQLIADWRDAPGPRPVGAPASVHMVEPSPPAVYVIGIDSYEELARTEPEGIDEAMGEVTHRLDRLVRSSDVLGLLQPGRFALATASVAPSTAGVIMERMTGAVAMPLELGGQPLSLSVSIGVAFAFDGTSAEAMLLAAEQDQLRPRSR
jgi:GGDEF domain-containing protein